LKMHRQMSDMMKKVGKKGGKGMMGALGGMGGGMPPGMGGMSPADMKAAQGLLSGANAQSLPGLPGGDTSKPAGLPGLGGGAPLGPEGLPIGLPKK